MVFLRSLLRRRRKRRPFFTSERRKRILAMRNKMRKSLMFERDYFIHTACLLIVEYGRQYFRGLRT